MPWANVGCGFWIRLTTTHDGNNEKSELQEAPYMRKINVMLIPASKLLTIDEIVGDTTHSAVCLDLTEMDKDPRIPLHPELREYALSLLRDQIPLVKLKQHCREWASRRWGPAPGDSKFRFILNTRETTSLYRTLARERGIPQRAAAQNNLDLWFRNENPKPPNPRLTTSCLHYSPFIPGQSECFELIISTPEQRELAWRYGHQKQILMDLTFGFCSGRALLAILMAIDEDNHGIPIAEIIFTAKKDTRAVHADYDTKLLDKLLAKWKLGMGTNAAGEQFEMKVASTDNDPRERTAIENNWTEVLLLLCMFHVWQAWRNGLNKHLRTIPKGPNRQEVRKRLGRFLMRLLKEISEYEKAIEAYNEELAYFLKLTKRRDKCSKQKGNGGLAFLAYLQGYLKLKDFWFSWSVAGAMEAAKRLGVAFEDIARTTNHLESFNGRIKGRYFEPYMHSGRLPRIDLWVLILITDALPNFFAEWAEARTRADYYKAMQHAPQFTSKSPVQPHSGTQNPSAAPIFSPNIQGSSQGKEALAAPGETRAEEMLKQLDEDEEDEGNVEENDAEDVEEMEGYGMQMLVAESGDESVLCNGSWDWQEGDGVDSDEDDSKAEAFQLEAVQLAGAESHF